MKIIVADQAGVESVIDGEAGWSLMEFIREAGLPIVAECGGCCICSTCHIYVAPEWVSRTGMPGGEEARTLCDAPAVTEASRLSCQIRMAPELEGLRVRLAPTW